MSSSALPGPLASRLNRLGTETAYAISGEAAALRATGKTIYPYHIGDLDFDTPNILVDETKKALDNKKTKYCAAQGIEELRVEIANYVGNERGVKYTKDNILVQAGGKPVIAKFLLSIMEEGDEVLFPTPGYPIYESLINFYGGVAKPYLYRETPAGFALDIAEIKRLITPKTKIFIYNNYHNPTGAVSTPQEMKAIADLCIEHNLWVLSDEAYFHLVYGKKHGDSIVALPGMLDRTVILLTASKSFAMTGWRLGAAIGHPALIASMTKLATNDEAMVTQFVQWGTIPAFKGACDSHVAEMRNKLQERRDFLFKKLQQVPFLKVTLPSSTFYMFANVDDAIKAVGVKTLEEFRKKLLNDTGISVCTRAHFGNPLASETHQYIRFAYSGISLELIEESINILKKYLEGFAGPKKSSL